MLPNISHYLSLRSFVLYNVELVLCKICWVLIEHHVSIYVYTNLSVLVNYACKLLTPRSLSTICTAYYNPFHWNFCAASKH